jgi:ABC-type phosphate transport system substrate-binding protein
MEVEMRLISRLLSTAAFFAVAAPGVADAAAPPPCANLTKLSDASPAPTPIYITGSSALKPLIAALGPIVFADPTKPFTVVYLSQGSCKGADAILNGTKLPATDFSTTPPAAPKNIASYWDASSGHAALQVVTIDEPAPGVKTGFQVKVTTDKEELCTLPAGPLQAADLGASDVFAQSCNYALTGIQAPFADFQGPVQSMTFAVNKQSAQTSISADAAYLTFGLGKLQPWVDGNFIFRRNASSGTQTMIGIAIGADPNNWAGVDKGSSDLVFAALTTGLGSQAEFDKAIGILSADYSARTELKQLAYQHKGQHCGFKPDIQPLDKRNTREGRYAIWGPIHLFTTVDASTSLPSNGHVRDFISYVTGAVAPPLGLNLIRTDVGAHVVPPCAMKVQRKAEMGPISTFKPPISCNCAWDKEALGQTTCAVCSNPSQCKANETCSFGYCEPQ